MINPKKRYKVLIVDDNPVNIEILRQFLDLERYQISAVTSGEKCLKLASKIRPDIILLDILMEGMDGYQTCEQLKANENTSDIPVIFVTAKVDPEDIRRGFRVGATDYLTKPVQREEAIARIENQLKIAEKFQIEREMVIESEKMSSLGSFVSSIAHEISTPLGSLNTALSFTVEQARQVQEDFDNKTLRPARLQDFLRNINEALGISQKNIENASMILHSFKLVAVDQCRYEVSEFNLKEYAENVLLSLKPKLKNTSHIVNLAISGVIVLHSYPGAISQIITNLVNNSLLHGFENKPQGQIDISATEDNDKITVVYQDNGKGIEPERLSKVFEDYYSTKHGEGGSGLGMGIIKRLVEEDLQGKMTLESEVGQGVCVTVTIPARIEAQ